MIENKMLENQEEVAETVPEESQEINQQQVESDAENNLRILRERSEKLARERDQALKKLQEVEQLKQQSQQQSYDYNIAPDDLVEGKHLSKYDQKIKQLEEQLNVYHQKTTEQAVEVKLANQYQDFNKVVNQGNIETLRELYPEIAATISSSNDLYNKAVSAYTMIKQLGIHKEDTYSEDREKASYNARKPHPVASVAPQQGDSPLSRANAFANGLTDDLKAQLRKEMEESRKKY